MSITISFVFVHLDTTQYRYSNDNYQTSQRKSQDINHQIHQDCNSKRSWLCGGHHLTRQCMYGNESNLFAQTKNEKAASCEQRVLERKTNKQSLWYRVHHEATKYKYINDNHWDLCTNIICRNAIAVSQGLCQAFQQRSW